MNLSRFPSHKRSLPVLVAVATVAGFQKLVGASAAKLDLVPGAVAAATSVSAASPKWTLIELEPTKHPPSLSYGAAGAN